MPFTVTLDSEGRLIDFKVSSTDSKINSEIGFEVAISNYGSPSNVTLPPAAQVVPATDSVYNFLSQ
jgi:hypothetical protein